MTRTRGRPDGYPAAALLRTRTPAPARDGRRVRARIPEGCRPPRARDLCLRRPLRRAPARRFRLPGRARAAQDRRRIPALYQPPAGTGLPAVPGADAVDDDRPAAA